LLLKSAKFKEVPRGIHRFFSRKTVVLHIVVSCSTPSDQRSRTPCLRFNFTTRIYQILPRNYGSRLSARGGTIFFDICIIFYLSKHIFPKSENTSTCVRSCILSGCKITT